MNICCREETACCLSVSPDDCLFYGTTGCVVDEELCHLFFLRCLVPTYLSRTLTVIALQGFLILFWFRNIISGRRCALFCNTQGWHSWVTRPSASIGGNCFNIVSGVFWPPVSVLLNHVYLEIISRWRTLVPSKAQWINGIIKTSAKTWRAVCLFLVYISHSCLEFVSQSLRREQVFVCVCAPLVKVWLYIHSSYLAILGQELICCTVLANSTGGGVLILSINTSTAGCEVCKAMVRKLCSSFLPGVSCRLVLIIQVQPLVRSWKADSVALYTLDMADLAAETCLFTHPDNISIHLEMCLLPQGEFMSTFNHVLALVFITSFKKISGCLAAKYATMLVDSLLST